MPPRDVPGPTAAQTLADTLRTRILAGDAAPGSPLREEDLAQEYGLSRHTVRTALASLGAERLVEIAPYRGARVADLDADGVAALQELRAAPASEAVRILRARHGEVWPASVRDPMDAAVAALADAEVSGDWLATTLAHAAVHRTIVEAAGSARITQAHAQLESEVLLLLTHLRPEYPQGSFAPQHNEYLAQIQMRGADAVREHLEHSTALIRAARRAV